MLYTQPSKKDLLGYLVKASSSKYILHNSACHMLIMLECYRCSLKHSSLRSVLWNSARPFMLDRPKVVRKRKEMQITARLMSLVAVLSRISALIRARAFKLAGLARPHAQLLPLGIGLCSFVHAFDAAKLGAGLGLIRRRQTALDQLQPDVAPRKVPPHVHGRDDAVILVSLVDVRSYVSVQDVSPQPLEGLGGVGLRRSPEMCSLWRVDARQTNGYLYSAAETAISYQNKMRVVVSSPCFLTYRAIFEISSFFGHLS